MCNCGDGDTLIPQVGVITDICTETADVKTFRVESRTERKTNLLAFSSKISLSCHTHSADPTLQEKTEQ